MSLSQLANQLVSQYGYLAVATGVGVESIGVPVPGETTLIAAAAYAGSTHRLTPAVVVAVAAAAAVVGDNLGFGLARWRGPDLLRWIGSRSVRADRALKAARDGFDRHPSSVIVGGRFVSVVRTYTAFLAGTGTMRWRRFAALNLLASLAWAALIGFGSAAVGSAFGLVAGYGTLAAVAAAVSLLGLLEHHRTRRPPAPVFLSHQDPLEEVSTTP